MIEYVIDYLTLSEPHRFIFICLEEHARHFDLDTFFRARTVNNYHLVLVRKITRGPADTALRARDFIDNGSELLIAYCDSFFTIDPADFLRHCRDREAEGGLITYPSSSAMDGYAEIGRDGRVLRTAEKELISRTAAAGLYYFCKGSDFVAAALQMLAASADHEEAFVCPVFNEMNRNGKHVTSFPIEREQRIEMGTPVDLARSREWLMQQEIEVARGAAQQCS
ncbi:MAG: sugar phosphate nucleotidyltransferase [Methyloceanibacter sp.]|nr:sugar phosphate nucleotidyltransferase [Methyloceanibacter sp.]